MRVLLSLAALGAVAAQQRPLEPLQQVPLPDDKGSAKPLVSSEALQDSISRGNLLKRAKDLYRIAKRSEDEYNHPTRVIGSEGEAPRPRARVLPTHCARRTSWDIVIHLLGIGRTRPLL